MAAFVVTIAEAVKDTLNGTTAQAGFSKKFQAVRDYVPIYDIKDLQNLKVTVVPSRYTPTNQTRSAITQKDCVIDVAVQRTVVQGKTSAIEIQDACDPLMSLAEEIGDLFRGKALTGQAGVYCITSENQVIYDPAMIDQMRVFTTVVQLTFRKVS